MYIFTVIESCKKKKDKKESPLFYEDDKAALLNYYSYVLNGVICHIVSFYLVVLCFPLKCVFSASKI